MQKELDKLSNQARFVKMIIDGKLTVSKKKKSVLVAELKKLGFTAYPKVRDASKDGETEEVVENDVDDDSATQAGASDYDYLLGMAIWSLTQERVEKLLKQIGDKEVEIDAIIKLSPKDLWNRDLDAFLDVWNAELDDEKKRKRKIAGIGRRASAKLGLSGKPSKRKRKGGDDSDASDDDFIVGKKKPAVKSVIDRLKGKGPSTMLSYFSNPAPPPKTKPKAKVPTTVAAPKPASSDNDFMDIDDFASDATPGAEPQVIAIKKREKPAATKTKIPIKPPAPASSSHNDDMSDDEIFAAVAKQAESLKASDPPARRARAATKKVTKYIASDSDDDSIGDDLGDVSMMVKGIENGGGEGSGSGSRTFFSNTAARPTSSHGLPRGIPKQKTAVDITEDSDGIDETDYRGLIPQGSPTRPAARRAGEAMASDIDVDMEDSFEMPPPKSIPLPKAKPLIKAKAAPPAKKKLVKTKPAASIVKKAVPLSPAAKAYAAKQEKAKALITKPAPKKGGKKAILSDEEEEDDLANDIISDEDEEDEAVVRPGRAAAARPGRRAVQTKKYTFSDDDSEAEESEQDVSFDVDESD
jgi:DNA topoisomerase-2